MVAQASNSSPAIRSSFVFAPLLLLLPVTFCNDEADDDEVPILLLLPLLPCDDEGGMALGVLKLRNVRSTRRASLSMEMSPDAVLASLPSANRNCGP